MKHQLTVSHWVGEQVNEWMCTRTDLSETSPDLERQFLNLILRAIDFSRICGFISVIAFGMSYTQIYHNLLIPHRIEDLLSRRFISVRIYLFRSIILMSSISIVGIVILHFLSRYPFEQIELASSAVIHLSSTVINTRCILTIEIKHYHFFHHENIFWFDQILSWFETAFAKSFGSRDDRIKANKIESKSWKGISLHFFDARSRARANKTVSNQMLDLQRR
jgi:hypothetical protein